MDAQFKKGTLEICVLSQLKHEDQYGYELTEQLSKDLDVTAGTLYLVLKRLKDSGYLETYLQESPSGPARKYYHITSKGITFFDKQKKDWLSFVEKVGKLI